MWETPPLSQLQEALLNASNPIGMRMRAVYFLRHYYQDHPTQVQQILNQSLSDWNHGSLMRHEIAYVMGQLRTGRESLEHIVTQEQDCTMVRHEAAEALGAIGSVESIPVLKQVVQSANNSSELRETCELSLNFIEWKHNPSLDEEEQPPACACMLNPYSSIDPAPPHPSHAKMEFQDLGNILRDCQTPMFERYRAMFSLRNRGGEAAVHELCCALVQDDSSALLRHEVAYVLGQMQSTSSIKALEASLRNTQEHDMVRHESAEALGAIDGDWSTVEPILQEFASDNNVVVRESCLVALDAADYWGHSNKEEEEEVVSFGQAKAHSTRERDRVLVNHFNVQA